MNVFQDTLRRTAERVEGVRAVSLFGVDGIPIDSYIVSDSVAADSIAAEMGALVKSARAANLPMGSGRIEQLAILTDRSIAIVCRVTEEYYLVLLMAGDGNFGRGRFELRRAAAALEKELL